MKNIIILTLSILTFTGCLPFIKMESGRTLEKGKASVGFTATTYKIDEDLTNTVVPYFDVKAKYGLSDRLELAGGVSTIGFIMFDGKYQLLGDKSSLFALSVGLGGDVLLLSINRDSDRIKNIKVSIPLYSSFHPSEKVYFFLNPQFSKQIVFDDNGKDIDFIGLSTGIGVYTKIGELNFGGSYFVPLSKLNRSISQIGISYRYNL